jgi:PAS domain S-box-containing protein
MQVRELAAVRATEMRLRLLIESVPSCVVLLAQDGMFQAMNWAGLPLVGAGRVDEVVGKNICTLLGGESAEQLRGFLARVCGGEKGTHEFEWAGMNGRLRKLVLRAVPFHRKADGPPGVLGVIDTAAASAAPPAQAAVSEEQLADWKTALEAARTEASRVEAERSAERDGWHQTRTELETRIEGLQARLELLQSEHATAVEQRQAEAAGREEAAKELERLREVSKMTHAAISDDRESLRACLADLTGKHREEQAELEALRAENARLREVCLTTEESLRAAESRQAQEPPTELATVAMQAVIELETPLKECGELVRQSLDAGDPRRRNAERLIELAGRAGSLTSRLLALGTWREALDLNRLIAQEEGSLQRLVPDSVAVLTILSPNLPRVPLRRQAVEQLLNTLVAHAGGSLTAGGTVTIITAIPPLTGGAPGPRVTLAVQASGEEVREPAVPELISLVERCKGSLNTTLDPQVGLLYEVVLPAERTQ